LSKKESLDKIAAEVIVCPKCRLSKSRKNAVPGKGSPKSPIIFVGEAPGYWEDIKGEPFVGVAGKFLTTLIDEIGFSRSDVFITNIVKCRPPKNRQPYSDEIEACTPYLNRQIKLIRPKIIVTLGNHSTAYVFSEAKLSFNGITRAHGKFYKTSLLGMNIVIFPTFHPAAALYSAKYKKQITKDFQLLRDELAKRRIVKR
jgi:DNA polymerase